MVFLTVQLQKTCLIPASFSWYNFLMQRGYSICNISHRHMKPSPSMAIIDAVVWSIFANITSRSTRLLSNQWSRQNMWGLNKYIFSICTLFTIPLNMLHLHDWYHRLIPAIMSIHFTKKITLSIYLLAYRLLVHATICN